MYRRTVIFGFLTLTFAGPSRAAGWPLISADEFERDRTAPRFRGGFAAAPQSGAPIIEVDQPDETKPLRAPLTIRLRFRPQGTASIDLASFRATYGWLGIDITSRILAHAQVSASGLVASNAEIPAGRHKVTLQIADNMHRLGTRTFEFTVI